MASALIGYTGFVGGTLARQHAFDSQFNSKNFRDMQGQTYDLVVCAGLPAAKWLINKDPRADWVNILNLQSVLETVTAREFILISTIDVYSGTAGLNEDAPFPTTSTMHAYGYHRLLFETFVQNRFAKPSVIRLPGLFGEGLRKNIIYDLLHDNGLAAINAASSFQWYPMDRLWQDIETVRRENIGVCNLFPEPMATARILELFPGKEVGQNAGPRAAYDQRTKYAALFGSHVDGYMLSESEVFASLQDYIAGQMPQAQKAS